MRPVAVRRVALLLGTALLACAGVFAWLANRSTGAPPSAPPSPPAPGAALFDTYCASCHTAERLRPGLDDPARRPALEVFLMNHGDASEADDRRILEYLSNDGGPGSR